MTTIKEARALLLEYERAFDVGDAGTERVRNAKERIIAALTAPQVEDVVEADDLDAALAKVAGLEGALRIERSRVDAALAEVAKVQEEFARNISAWTSDNNTLRAEVERLRSESQERMDRLNATTGSLLSADKHADNLQCALDEATKECRSCHGTGDYYPHCDKCDDSTWDHVDCPPKQTCEQCARIRAIARGAKP
jgi:chromosome segregation ATPase